MVIKSLYPPLPPLPETNFFNFAFRRPDQAEWGPHTVYIDSVTGKKVTWQQFRTDSEDAATALSTTPSLGGLGLTEKDMVAIISPNGLEYPVLTMGLLAITVPFALVAASSTKFELEHGLRLSNANVIFVHPRILPKVLPVAKLLGISTKKIYIFNGTAKGHHNLHDMIHRVRKLKTSPVGVRPATSTTLAYLTFSSGTTGLPKAVMITHGNVLYSVLQGVVVGMTVAASPNAPPPRKEPPVSLAFLPMHHAFGLHVYILRTCMAPMTFVFIPRWEVGPVLKLIPKYRITHLSVVPSVVHQFVNYPGIEKADLSSLEWCSSGAAYLPPDLAVRLSKLVPKVAITQGYGMSEGTIAATAVPSPGVLGDRQPVLGSTGILLPGLVARIVKDDGSDAAIGEVGELYLQGGNVSPGYWQNEKANSQTFVDGWLHTGDQFHVDKDGNFFFADRAKDTLKVSGIQVSPLEIENVLLQHPDRLVTDVTVAGVTGGRTADEKVPRAWIVLSAAGHKLGKAEAVKQLEQWHQESLSKFKWLRGGIEVVKEIPKSPTGKVLRRVLVDRHEQKAKKLKSKL